MDRPLDRLTAALRDYAVREPQHIRTVVFYGMLHLGGRYPREGILPAPPPGVKDKRNMGQIHGHNTLDHLIDRLTVLVTRYGLNDMFLVPAFVQAIDFEFERQLDGVVPGAKRSREEAETFERLASDPEMLREWNESVFHKGGPMTAGDALEMAAFVREMGTPSLGKIKERREALESWREIVGPVADREYLDEYLHELAMQAYEQMPDEPPR